MIIRFGSPANVESIAEAVSLYGRKEFESPTRSTVPMLSLLRHRFKLFNEIIQRLEFSLEYELTLEHTERPPKGRGKASHTDVMLTAGQAALAIEGKWTEPMYDTVGKWLKAGKDQANRQAVLEGWLSLLADRLGRQFSSDDFADVIYQMIHRAASAAVARKPRMAYFIFEPSSDARSANAKEVINKLEDLWNRLGRPGEFPFYVVAIHVKETEAYLPLRALPKGEEETAEAVCAALQGSDPLFEFAIREVHRVGKAEVGK